ncbi:hypothetical protein SAMN02910369_00875 [Lachnospiraceae bacterium NE2001]|nr:hypothetical protein SAMN02910369_00875 [Lachnospiraceae bacterium NE2001]
MARKGLIGSLFTVTAAAAAVAGVAYLFKEEIRETKTYKDLNDKYDVDRKIKEYSVKAKDTAYDLKDKAKVAAKDIKAKADEWKAAQEDDIFEDDEIIINDADFSEDRDYVSIKTEDTTESVQEAADAVQEAVENVDEDAVDAAKDVAEEAKDKAEDAVDAAKDVAEDAKDKAKDAVDAVKDAASNIVEEINID